MLVDFTKADGRTTAMSTSMSSLASMIAALNCDYGLISKITPGAPN